MKGLSAIRIMSASKFNEVGITKDEELYMVETPVVLEFAQTAEAWYRLWSDDTLEQGGRCWVGDVGSNGSVNFLKPFASTPMACGSKSEHGSFSESSGCINNITATNITMGLRWGGDNSRGGRYCSYYAIGKAAK